MQVAETNIQFNTLIPRKATRRIVLHHSASGVNTTWQDIQRWHLGNGWAGIGYHYVIHADGGIYRGRPEGMSGAHAYQDRDHEANSDGIGICLIGNFETGVPTEAQLVSTVELIRDIRTRYPGIPVIGHKDVMPTACPGRNFPWAEMTKRLEEDELEEDEKVIYKTFADLPDWAKPTIKKLMDRKSIYGDGKGNINLSEDAVRVLVILDREGVLK